MQSDCIVWALSFFFFFLLDLLSRRHSGIYRASRVPSTIAVATFSGDCCHVNVPLCGPVVTLLKCLETVFEPSSHAGKLLFFFVVPCAGPLNWELNSRQGNKRAAGWGADLWGLGTGQEKDKIERRHTTRTWSSHHLLSACVMQLPVYAFLLWPRVLCCDPECFVVVMCGEYVDKRTAMLRAAFPTSNINTTLTNWPTSHCQYNALQVKQMWLQWRP